MPFPSVIVAVLMHMQPVAASPLAIERVCRMDDAICDVVELATDDQVGSCCLAVVTPTGYRVIDASNGWATITSVAFVPELAMRAASGFEPIDLDADGTLEFIARPGIRTTSLTVLNDDGSLRWTSSPPNMSAIEVVRSYDGDGDGKHEIIAFAKNSGTVARYRHDGSLISADDWDLHTNLELNLQFMDVTHDGRPEIIYGSGDSIVVMGADGKRLLRARIDCTKPYATSIYFHPHLQTNEADTILHVGAYCKGERHRFLLRLGPGDAPGTIDVLSWNALGEEESKKLLDRFAWRDFSWSEVERGTYSVSCFQKPQRDIPGFARTIEVRDPSGKQISAHELVTTVRMPWEQSGAVRVLGKPGTAQKLLVSWGDELYVIQASKATPHSETSPRDR